jgi:glycosyltransferase involved in cell wall biosynthesis
VPLSVVVPAHDEELVMGRFLTSLLADARPGELDVVVVCNGCQDRTAAVAREFPVRVVETSTASKHVALNWGDRLAQSFPRFYVDADVQVSARALRATAQMLTSGGALAAAPRLRLDLSGCSAPVRAYYRVWHRLPYCSTDMVGSGVYGVSEAGRRRIGPFPEIIADDLWFRNQFRPGERRSVREVAFVQHPPRDMRSLVRVRTRQCLGKLQYEREFGGHFGAPRRERVSYLRRLLSPRAVLGAPVYLGVNTLARRRARRRWTEGALQWDSDVSARLGRST